MSQTVRLDFEADFEAEFERAWANPVHTPVELPEVDVNRLLSERYRTSVPLVFTRMMLWDVEVRKAASPADYIPFTVADGSASVWARGAAPGGGEYFLRCSRQRLWLQPDQYATVLERVYLDHREQRVTFLGAQQLEDPEGKLVHADTTQPLFHVEHSVGGAELQPLNRWRIVHLTEHVDDRLLARFSQLAERAWLPEYIEIYVRRDLGLELTRLDA